ncbi:hypothetical protein ACQP3L_34335, partial [Escherichia coli]
RERTVILFRYSDSNKVICNGPPSNLTDEKEDSLIGTAWVTSGITGLFFGQKDRGSHTKITILK